MNRFLILIAILCFPLYGATVWQDVNLYSPAASVNQGDTIVVIVEDISQLRYTLDVENKASSSVNSTPDTTITAFLPAVNSTSDITHNDGIKVESRGNLSMRIGASVGAPQNDGTYIIQGTKTYNFNGTANTIAVAGRINPSVLDGSTVKSESVINFQLTINTTTQGINLNLDRQLEEEESASTELTEEEKQQIITDYLERMLNEISK